MVVTESFVYIHQPKTGGTFVESAIARVYDDVPPFLSLLRAMLPDSPKRPYFRNLRVGWQGNQHGRCLDIPKKHLAKPILSTKRNPFDYLVSRYEYKWWARFPEKFGWARAKDRFPSFPNVTYSEFLKLIYLESTLKDGDKRLACFDTLGSCAYSFLHYHSDLDKEGIFALIGLSRDEILRRVRESLFPVRFIEQSRLNDELFKALRDLGYPEEKVGFILGDGRILPPMSSRENHDWRHYYTPVEFEFLREKEWLLLSLFPDFGSLTLSDP